MQQSSDTCPRFPRAKPACTRPRADLICLVLYAALVLSAAAAPACPEGLKPKKALSIFPLPGGFIMDFLMYSIDPLNNCYHVWVFWSNGDKAFAWVSAVFVGLTLIAFLALIKIPGGALASSGSLMEECRRSSGRGILTEAVARVNFAKEGIQGPGTGLVNIYGLAQLPTLKLVPLASAMYGLYSSSKGIALGLQEAQTGVVNMLEKTKGLQEQQAAIMGGKDWMGNVDTAGNSLSKDELATCSLGGPIVLKKRFGWKWSALVAYFLVLVAGELALFAVMANVFHPAVIIVGFYFPNAVARLIDVGSYCCGLCETLFAPSTLFFPTGVSPFGVLPFQKSEVMFGGKCRLVAQVVRLIALPAMAWYLELPEGLPGWEALHRPMGHSVFESMFLKPTMATYKVIAECAVSLASKSAAGCALPLMENDKSILQPGSIIFHAFLTCVVCVAVPVHVIASLVLLSSSRFRNGGSDAVDAELIAEIQAKEIEIQRWAESRYDERKDASLAEMARWDVCGGGPDSAPAE